MGASAGISQICHQWTEFREDMGEGEAWLHAPGGIRGVTVRPDESGITLSIPVGNSAGDFALAWELMRLGVKHGAAASGEDEDGILSLSADETERITRKISDFHWGVLLSSVKESGISSLPVAGRIHLEISAEDCADGAEGLERNLVERMNRYSNSFTASLMSMNKDGAAHLISVYSQIPTLVDARTELLQLAGDNLPPEIASKIKPVPADFVYDLLEAEHLGPLVYIPPPTSELVLHTMIVMATAGDDEGGPPAPNVPARTEMTADDWAILAKSPCLVFLLVAACDGSIDKKELIQFGKLLTNHAKEPTPIVRKILNITTNNVGTMFESMSDTNASADLLVVGGLLRSGKLPAEDAKAFSAFLYKLGEEVASASGGFLGFGSKISKKEAEMLEALKVFLMV